MLSSQYEPLLSTSTEWASEYHGFAENLTAALDSLAGGFEWKSSATSSFATGATGAAEEPFLDSTNWRDTSTVLEKLEKDPTLMQRMETILEEWCDAIEKYVSSVSSSEACPPTAKVLGKGGLEVKDVGPKGELDFWRSKMQRLNSVSEYFQSAKCKELIGVLKEVSKVKGGRMISKTRIPELLNRWTNLENMVTMSATETKDNVKYLSSLQRFVGPFYHGTVKGMNDAIPALLNSVK
eukprot:CAMPEP_0176504054 /NCGR_PEP_ID=MMETSP0200_2-20121128/15715_1 /TAXON_ID=947934 /ORGANISM="Chaetoceros sp., Strain GSL56" /LENGTH=237 /DNA_ID=CAMNT_0017903433 /DNA_START=280 /DNA_END=990 /DNA_ORIENTATION=-